VSAGRSAFLLFSGSNDRAVHALARVMAACGEPFSVIARGSGDRILLSAFRTHVKTTRMHDSLEPGTFEGYLQAVGASAADRYTIVPGSEFLNLFLLGLDRQRLRSQFGCEIPLVEPTLYHLLTNKESSARLFGEAGFRVPAVLDAFEPGSLPLVAKPRHNLGRTGLIQYPFLLETRADLDAFLAQEHTEGYFPQEFVRGESHYLLTYFSRSGEVFASSQLNLAQQPGGKSILLAETSNFKESETARKSIELLQRVKFHGFAMIEFIVDARGPCFIEVNPRPWGPMQLCADHACGIIEAFVGDYAHQDPWRYRRIWAAKPERARYLWSGGMVQTLRGRQRPRWHSASLAGRMRSLALSVPWDVYLRRDTLRVFLNEMVNHEG
jgi:predicted ATP-grasp superfamily ATP-dependent carboligase